MIKSPLVTIVVPCFNEEEVLLKTYGMLREILLGLMESGRVNEESKILFVDDGSKDRTWNLIEETFNADPMVYGLKLSRNFGHQKALLAGLEHAAAFSDCVISIDADLQDDVTVIKTFIEKYSEGNDIVYGVRRKRETDTFFKKTTAEFYYRFMEKLGLPLIFNHADYRLLGSRPLKALLEYKETHLFLRGIIPSLGFKSAVVYYDRKARAAGKSKYNLAKMIGLALDGITSFSVKPIRWITFTGFLAAIISIIAAVFVLFQKISANTVSGWASIMISLWFIGGLLLIGIGMIGEYIGKIYEEVKNRPRYIVERRLYKKAVGMPEPPTLHKVKRI